MARPVLLTTIALHPDGAAVPALHAELHVAPDMSPEAIRACAQEADGIVVRSELPDDICDRAPRLCGIVLRILHGKRPRNLVNPDYRRNA